MASAAQLSPALPSDEHVSWLLVSAYTHLQQNKPARALALLEFLRVFDRENQDCLKMLAYARLQQGDRQEGLALIEELLQTPLSDEERAALYYLRMRAAQGNGQEAGRLYQDCAAQFALLLERRDEESAG